MSTQCKKPNIRFAAYKVIYSVFYLSESLDSSIDKISDEFSIKEKNYTLLRNICYGTVQNFSLLDYFIGQSSSVPIKKLNKKVLCILRIAFYQFIFLSKIPAYSIIDEAVKSAKILKLGRLCGFINAVLRKASITQFDIDYHFSDNEFENLSIRYSHPLYYINRLSSIFDSQSIRKILASNNTEPKLCIQINTCLIKDEMFLSLLDSNNVSYSISDICPHCIILNENMRVENIPGYEEGLFYVQDIAAKLAIYSLAPNNGDSILDVCAAPGGKTISAYMLYDGKSNITSCDISNFKINKITENISRLKLNNVSVLNSDASVCNHSFIEKFDIVIADVPCSASGVIRKIPEIRLKQEEAIKDLCNKQRQILSVVSKYVKSDGVLLYSTCSVFDDENGMIIRDFLNENPDFYYEDFTFGEIKSKNGSFTFYPGFWGTDGFYICKLRKSK